MDNLNLAEFVNDLIVTLVVTYCNSYTRFSQSPNNLERFEVILTYKTNTAHTFSTNIWWIKRFVKLLDKMIQFERLKKKTKYPLKKKKKISTQLKILEIQLSKV